MKTIIVFMFAELIIGLLVGLFIWLKNSYNLIKYPDIYQIRKVCRDEDLIPWSQNYIFDTFFNFLSVEYLFAIVHYQNNQIIEKNLHTLFGSSIKITFDEKGNSIPYKSMIRSPMYSLLVILPLLLSLTIHQQTLSNNFKTSGLIWLFVGFAIPSILKNLKLEFLEILQQIKEDDHNLNS